MKSSMQEIIDYLNECSLGELDDYLKKNPNESFALMLRSTMLRKTGYEAYFGIAMDMPWNRYAELALSDAQKASYVGFEKYKGTRLEPDKLKQWAKEYLNELPEIIRNGYQAGMG